MTVPFDKLLWDAQDCADYFKESRQEFLRTRRHKAGFPPELENCPRRWSAAAVTAWRDSPVPRPTALYRHYSADGALLYVGISLTATLRTAKHRLSSRWFELVATIKVEHFVTREAALKAERLAIRSEKPQFNRAHRG